MGPNVDSQAEAAETGLASGWEWVNLFRFLSLSGISALSRL